MPQVAGAQREKQAAPAGISADVLREALGGVATIVDYDVSTAVGKGENYLSTLYRVRVRFRPATAEDAAEIATAHLVVKALPAGEFMQTYVESMGVFEREARIYGETLPRFYAQADGGGGGGGAGAPFPRFSPAALPSSRPDILVLEDLRAQGFAMADRRARLDLAHSRLVVSRLARLHALSLAYEQTHPGYLQEFSASPIYTETQRNNLKQYIPSFPKGLADVARTWDGFDKIADKLERLEQTIVDRVIEMCRPQEAGWNVMLHGDCWVNNILFKYGPDGTPEDLRFVDFQLAQRGSPALDLNYFLYASPRDEVRAQHGDELLQEYCAELRRTAAAAGFSGETPSLPQLRREMERFLFFGLFSALTMLAAVLSDPEETPDLSELKTEDVQKGEVTNIFFLPQSSKPYCETFQELLPYFDEMGVLD